MLTGAGRAFCSGQDLGDGADRAAIDLERVLRDEYGPMLAAILDCPVPVIAAVNGAAAGAGANLALVADVIIASEDAFFQQAFTRIGLIPDAGGTWFLPRIVGYQRAMGAALFADRISARQAADWGMVYEAVPAAEFEAHYPDRAGPEQVAEAAVRSLRVMNLEAARLREREGELEAAVADLSVSSTTPDRRRCTSSRSDWSPRAGAQPVAGWARPATGGSAVGTRGRRSGRSAR